MKRAIIGLLCLAGGCLLGCKTQQQTSDTLRILKDGKARGHLTLATDGRVGVGMDNNFYIGAKDTSIAFDGDIDFGHTGGERPTGPTP
jgi:hypothetical protein